VGFTGLGRTLMTENSTVSRETHQSPFPIARDTRKEKESGDGRKATSTLMILQYFSATQL